MSDYEVRTGSDGEYGIYVAGMNVRVATFAKCSAQDRERIAAMLSLSPRDWYQLDGVFLPTNPNKMRKACPEIVDLVRRVKALARRVCQ